MISRALTALDRRLIAFRRRNHRLRHLIPLGISRRAKGMLSRLDPVRFLVVRPVVRSPHANLFHCSIHKTGSQWVSSVLTDFRTFQYTGLRRTGFRTDHTILGPVSGRRFPEGYPAGTIITPMYVTYENFREMPKAGSFRAFFVLRDPRDVIVSWYFSARYSHRTTPDPTRPLSQARLALSSMTEREGLHYAVDYAERMGWFATLASWHDAPAQDPNVTVVRFEDLVGPDSRATFRGLLDFLDVPMPDADLDALLEAYSFERLSGRKRGSENPKSHLRSGSSGGWRSRFDDELTTHFKSVTGNLVERLGYGW